MSKSGHAFLWKSAQCQSLDYCTRRGTREDRQVKQHGPAVVGRRLGPNGLWFVKNFFFPPKHANCSASHPILRAANR